MRSSGKKRIAVLRTLALSLLAGAIGVGASPAVAAGDESVVLRTFELKGANGHEIEVIEVRLGDSPPEAGLLATKRKLRAEYVVPGEPVPEMRATFGSLGSVAMQFERRKREVERPEKGCVRIIETGTFSGAFSFTGEGGYTSAAATSVPGGVVRLPNGFCGFGGFAQSSAGKQRIPIPPGLPRVTLLTARTPVVGGFAEFAARVEEDSRIASFSASLVERVGPMKVTRSALSRGRGGFERTPAKGAARSAEFKPPAPFTGTASYRQGAGAEAWTGSLVVPLPGAGVVPLTGSNFKIQFCERSIFAADCDDKPLFTGGPRRPAPGFPQLSGSQSQAFWDARLSWSR